MTLRDLANMGDPHSHGGDEGGDGIIELMLFQKENGELVSAGEEALPTILRVSVDRTSLQKCVADDDDKRGDGGEGRRRSYEKRLMIVTRGTRGDIQPFVALSRGLATLRNWDITIVTELSYKERLKKATANLSSGIVRFRPTGGDTMTKVSSKTSQTAINLKVCSQQTNAMQKIFLARSEVEFFGSEPAVYYWARKERPDFLMFGFTMATVTLIASEALRIPVMGFVLQPTSIPSAAYPPILPLKESTLEKMSGDAVREKHDHFKMAKFLMDNAGGGIGTGTTDTKSAMRTRRGLQPYKSYETSTWQELRDKNLPLIVPINATMFGGKPDDWSENTVLTDCIFLRGDAIPPVADDAVSFVTNAKSKGGKIVVLAFSSMPVSKTDICAIALKLIRECESKTYVFALVGGQMNDPFPDPRVEISVTKAVAGGRLFLAPGAPFGRLFPLVDAVVLHGGLGTTSEALQAKLPTIVTGVMLLDQRFWGSRCKKMGVGPFGVHVDDFPDVCVENVDRALAENSIWKENASRIGSLLLEEAGDDPSGVKRNVDCVVEMSEVAKPYRYSQSEDSSVATRRRSVAKQLLKESIQSLRKDVRDWDKIDVQMDEDDLFSDEVYVEAV
mmetsp:Transcript_30357/g.64028  ORF Transcript_30357/g.64028 Transcript_30357/m.64028 type:complete len:617 (-) Transcript_30357:134-1984(-)